MSNGPQTCPLHHVEFVFKPPGVSRKTGRPYDGFFACPVPGCTPAMRAQAQQPQGYFPPTPAPQQAPYPPPQPAPQGWVSHPVGPIQSPPPTYPQNHQATRKPEPDWDAIAAGKVRHGLVCAMIQAQWDIDRIKSELPWLTALVMDGPQASAEQPPPPVDADVPW